MIDVDSAAARAFERSALVQWIERGAVRFRVAGSRSIVIARAGSWARTARPHSGYVLVGAAATHLLLMVTIGRPLSWHFAILPSIFLAAGAVLIATSTRNR
ncbi:MAG TPA: hypothetical protein VM096_04895 [Vicinamibacterales bacterium]|nr:hypothetical protein [Vicinamibacterales bacterium]